VTHRPALIATLALSATLAPRPATADAGAGGVVAIRVAEGSKSVEVVGLEDTQRRALLALPHPDDRWAEILAVRVSRPEGGPEAAPIVGRHEVAGDILRFVPRYPLSPGVRFLARFRPARVPGALADHPPIDLAFTIPAPSPGPPAEVAAVYPTASTLPENQLKLYLHFTRPMARGEAYRRVRLVDDSGRPVERPFLEVGEELWDPGLTRLTLLFDPGRIKRGLKPREEEGPILVEGRSYTLEVDPAWADASGRPLRTGHRKAFRVGPPDLTQPDLARWKADAPPVGTRAALVVRFPEPLDRAMLDRAIEVRVGAEPVAGRVEVGREERSWRLVPDRPWGVGALELRVDSELEDLAGNSPSRPFEVDLVRPRPEAGEVPRSLTLPVPRTP